LKPEEWVSKRVRHLDGTVVVFRTEPLPFEKLEPLKAVGIYFEGTDDLVGFAVESNNSVGTQKRLTSFLGSLIESYLKENPVQ